MPRAILRNDHGAERSFDLLFCPVWLSYRERVWALQESRAGDPPDLFRYRDITIPVLEDIAIAPPPEAPAEQAALDLEEA